MSVFERALDPIMAGGNSSAVQLQKSPYEKFLYAYLIFILSIVFTTSNSLTLKTPLFYVHLAGVKNPLTLLLLLWFLFHLFRLFRNIPRTRVDYAIIGMLGICLVSTFFSSNTRESTLYLYDMLLYIGFFYLTLDLVKTRENIIHVMYILLTTGFVVVSMNLFYLAENEFCSLGVLERYPFWTGKTPLGFYNSFIIAFFSGFLLYGWKTSVRFLKYLIIILLVGSAISLFFSFTRGSWLTVMIILSLAGMMKYGRKFFYPAAITLLLLLIIFHGTVNSIILAVYNINSENVDDRIYLWKSSLDMVRDHPFLGVGPGTFNENYLNKYQLLESSRWNDSYHAHNVFLHLSAEQGYLGLLAFLLFWGVAIHGLSHNFSLNSRADPLTSGLNCGIFFSILNYFLWSLTNTSLGSVTKSFYNINLIIWFFTALIFIIPHLVRQGEQR